MACDHIQPSLFVKEGEKIEVVFLNEEEEPSWYKGVVTKVDHYGKDNHGEYVECDVDYEDGETVTDTRFYDCDFNDETSLDAWRFSSSLTRVIETLDDTKKEIEMLREGSDGSCDSEYDSDHDEPYARRPSSPVSQAVIGLSLMMMTGLIIKRLYMKYIDECNERAYQYSICDISDLFDTFQKSCFNVIDRLKNSSHS